MTRPFGAWKGLDVGLGPRTKPLLTVQKWRIQKSPVRESLELHVGAMRNMADSIKERSKHVPDSKAMHLFLVANLVSNSKHCYY